MTFPANQEATSPILAEVPVPLRSVAPSDAARLAFVQRMRVFLICLVVAHHAGQAYGPTGGSWPFREAQAAEWLGPFFAINASFFMGLFFLLSGYFTVSSYQRKGFANYTFDRLIRLGIPLVIYALLVLPVARYLAEPTGSLAQSVIGRISSGDITAGHLWFVSLLLLLSICYAIAALFAGSSGRGWNIPAPSDKLVLGYALVLGASGALVRFAYPQDSWLTFMGLLSVEPAHLPQYLSLFAIGLVAGPSEWLSRIPSRLCIRWFGAGIVAFAAMVAIYRLDPPLPAWFGFQQVMGFAEGFICVGMILGCVALFRTFGTRSSTWLATLDANIYGVYLVHWLIVVALQGALFELSWPVSAKFLVVTVAALVASYLLSMALRAIPGVRRVI
jgi:glucans biosynthesis protein C